MVFVLHRLYEDLPIERLLALFAAGGVSGTLKEWYGQEGEPYLYAKTGTLANNHCLSGYLKTRSGRILIFSFMNNHYMQNTVQIKEQMQGLFEWLRDQY
jgi:D-alanyl-D-alanine carboxypeptidase/D-alanyl-D-alanine-endopeptidase (penicillin-binding protein 4)